MVPAWFNSETYLSNKLEALGSGWDMNSLLQAFASAGYDNSSEGMYRHFLEYGNKENISPNDLFDVAVYKANKLAQLQSDQAYSNFSLDDLDRVMEQSGMSYWDHYTKYGMREGVNPSDKFDTNIYLQNKLTQLQNADPSSSWDANKLLDVFESLGMNPVMHYSLYGKSENINTTSITDPTPQPVSSWPYVPSEGNVIYGTENGDIIQGTAENDIIYGMSGNDWITGESAEESDGNTYLNYTKYSSDYIDGGNGDDHIFADGYTYNYSNKHVEGGNDIIRGGSGDDAITGGYGKDIFIFESTADANGKDTISDFTPAEGDILDFTAYLGHSASGGKVQVGNYNDPDSFSDIVLDATNSILVIYNVGSIDSTPFDASVRDRDGNIIHLYHYTVNNTLEFNNGCRIKFADDEPNYVVLMTDEYTHKDGGYKVYYMSDEIENVGVITSSDAFDIANFA